MPCLVHAESKHTPTHNFPHRIRLASEVWFKVVVMDRFLLVE